MQGCVSCPQDPQLLESDNGNKCLLFSCLCSNYLTRIQDISQTSHQELIRLMSDDSFRIQCTRLTCYQDNPNKALHRSPHRCELLYGSCRIDTVLLRYLLSCEYLRYSSSIEEISKNNLCITSSISQPMSKPHKLKQAIKGCSLKRRFKWKTSQQ